MTLFPAPMCYACAHFHGREGIERTCEAFPRGIPHRLHFECGDHRKPWKGDQGIQFELAEGEEMFSWFED